MDNLQLIGLAGYLLVNVFNALTPHWSKAKGIVKVLTFVTEALSFVTSKGVLNDTAGKLKMPLQVNVKKKSG